MSFRQENFNDKFSKHLSGIFNSVSNKIHTKEIIPMLSSIIKNEENNLKNIDIPPPAPARPKPAAEVKMPSPEFLARTAQLKGRTPVPVVMPPAAEILSISAAIGRVRAAGADFQFFSSRPYALG